MRFYVLIFLIFVSFIISGCSIYRSSDRVEFENDAPQNTPTVGFTIQSCSQTSISIESQKSRFVTNLSDDEVLWEHLINETAYYESIHRNGQYCLYKVTTE